MTQQLSPQVIPATLEDYQTIQNMAQLYVYDASRECGFCLSPNGLYEPNDYKIYFENQTRKALLIKVGDELAGFALLNRSSILAETGWKVDQFFILAKFQGKGIGKQVAHQIWTAHQGLWEVSIVPENKSALSFWRKIISSFTNDKYKEELKEIDFDVHQPMRYILSFDTKEYSESNPLDASMIRQAEAHDILAMVALSYKKRRDYEKHQPQFWRYATNAEDHQAKWFQELLFQDDSIILVAESNNAMKGFIIGRIMKAPKVYDPGGFALMIDDFCVETPAYWPSVGCELLVRIKDIAKTRGIVQMIVVAGHHDEPKRQFLRNQGLTLASEWYVGGILK